MDDVRVEDGPVQQVEIDVNNLFNKQRIVTDSIDLTLESIFAGEEDHSLLPDRHRRIRELEDPDSVWCSMNIWGQALDIKIAFIPLPGGDFTIREITLLDDLFSEQYRFMQDTLKCYGNLFDEPAPWDEEEMYYKECGCIRCGKELNFFVEYNIDMCVECVDEFNNPEVSLTNEV